MPTYKVIEHNSVGKIYEVEADSEEKAEETYSEGECVKTDVVERFVVQIDVMEEVDNEQYTQ